MPCSQHSSKYRTAGFGLLEDDDDLAVGKARGLHVELPVSQVENSTSDPAFFVGGLLGLARLCQRKRM